MPERLSHRRWSSVIGASLIPTGGYGLFVLFFQYVLGLQ